MSSEFYQCQAVFDIHNIHFFSRSHCLITFCFVQRECLETAGAGPKSELHAFSNVSFSDFKQKPGYYFD